MSGSAYAERNEAILAMYQAGNTLEVIGVLFGISRERVRQIIRRMGYRGTFGSRAGDPVRIVAALRDSSSRSMADIAHGAGTDRATVSEVLTALGLREAANRLLQRRGRGWGRRDGEKWARYIAFARAWAAEHGRSPSVAHTQDRQPRLYMVNTGEVYRLFGSWHDFLREAGLAAIRRRNGESPHGCLNRYATYGCRCDQCRSAAHEYYLSRRRVGAA